MEMMRVLSYMEPLSFEQILSRPPLDVGAVIQWGGADLYIGRVGMLAGQRHYLVMRRGESYQVPATAIEPGRVSRPAQQPCLWPDCRCDDVCPERKA